MKIGFFTDTYTPQINGVVTSILTFKNELEKLGHDVYIFAPTPKQKNDSKKTIRFPSVKFFFQPEMRFAFPYSQKALKLIEKINLDIVHSHDPFSIGLFGLWLAKRKKIPYVHTYHTLYPEYIHYIWETKFTKEWSKILSRKFCNKCDSIIAPSTKIKNYLKKWGTSKPIEIIPTGINIEEFKEKNGEITKFKNKYKISSNDKLLIFIGRIGKEKNIGLLIRTIKKVKNKNVKLLIAGNGPYKTELLKLAKKVGVENKILFLGYLPRKEVIAAYKSSYIFIFSSKSETQGLVIAEAMTAGLPVIAVSDLAIADMVKDKKNGYLVKSDVDEFAEKIDKLLKDKNLYKKMSKNSKILSKELSARKQAKKLENVYKKLLNQ